MKLPLPLVLATSLLVGDRASAEPPGFYIPSLQTLLMMPLSRAGDRLEATWAKQRGSQGTCDCSEDACDSLTRAPSYELDETLMWQAPALQAPPKPSSFQENSGKELRDGPLDRDEQLALEWNAPVKVGSVKSGSAKSGQVKVDSPKPVVNDLEELAQAPSVQQASGTSPSKGVRLTGVSQARGQNSGTPAKAGQIKDKYLDRKRSAQ